MYYRDSHSKSRETSIKLNQLYCIFNKGIILYSSAWPPSFHNCYTSGALVSCVANAVQATVLAYVGQPDDLPE